MACRVLLTCFQPFGGRATNASALAVSLVPDIVGRLSIRKLELPVAFGRATELAASQARAIGAHAILCVGEAAGRDKVSFELRAKNLRDARIPDNAGFSPFGAPVVDGAGEVLLSTLPMREMADAACEAGVPAEVSDDAGAFVCNDLLFGLLDAFSGQGVRCGFVHVPLEGVMDPAESARAIVAALGVMGENLPS